MKKFIEVSDDDLKDILAENGFRDTFEEAVRDTTNDCPIILEVEINEIGKYKQSWKKIEPPKISKKHK